MILCGRKRAEHAICQCGSCWFPALFDGVEFWSVCRKVFDVDCPAVSTAEVVDLFASVCRTVVDKEQDAPPAPQGACQKLDEVSLSFSLAEQVYEAPLASCTEHVGANILVIDKHRRVAAAARPAARYDGNQSESCFILCSDDEAALPIFAHQSTRFFLKRSISSGDALW